LSLTHHDLPQLALRHAVTTLAVATYCSEREKRAGWSIENERRRHNFVPFLMELLQQLAAYGELKPMYEAGKRKAEEARGRARAAAREKKEAGLTASGAGSAMSTKP
jgi:hypothetical protein